jgi:hypothetical protein
MNRKNQGQGGETRGGETEKDNRKEEWAQVQEKCLCVGGGLEELKRFCHSTGHPAGTVNGWL